MYSVPWSAIYNFFTPFCNFQWWESNFFIFVLFKCCISELKIHNLSFTADSLFNLYEMFEKMVGFWCCTLTFKSFVLLTVTDWHFVTHFYPDTTWAGYIIQQILGGLHDVTFFPLLSTSGPCSHVIAAASRNSVGIFVGDQK